MKILSWNVAGIRATIKKGNLDFLETSDYDIVCFQETKADEQQVILNDNIKNIYPYRYWKSTQGITQRKGFSGTSIWSKIKPIKELDIPDIDSEGRVTTLEFDDFIISTVYTPNSQSLTSERHIYRVSLWDEFFLDYINNLNKIKPTIVCGDLNVANEDIDIYNPKQLSNKAAGFLDSERENFKKILNNGWIDTFRFKNPNLINQYTYWDQRHPQLRSSNRGWRIDYFLLPNKYKNKINNSEILPDIKGSDHCPIALDFNFKKKKLKILNN